ncbi:MAG: sugar phosphate isomerase/epimerase [Candidatus Latescibacteria bacterium]|nr:sugar phosphate isomerase/epimerase [Candidatus Latescibacterota bacterium]
MSRRNAITVGAAAAGVVIGADRGAAARPMSAGPGREEFWGPGPNKNLVRDLTPGKTTVRLAGYLRYEEGEDIGEKVRGLSAKGLSAAITGVDPWHGMSDSVVRELRAALEQYDVVIFEVGGYRNLLHPDDTARRENLRHIARCLEAAEKVGCRMVGTISGSRNPEGNQWGDNYAVHPDNWTIGTWRLLVDGIRQILKDTAGLKAAIGMEAQVTTNIDGPLAHRRLMDDVGSDRLRVNLDPTNMVHLYNHFHTTELIGECFDLLGEDIYGCHAKDTYVLPHSQTVHVQEVCPGRGGLDYETYLVRMSRLEWSRSLLPEHIPADQFDEAYAYIREVAGRVGVKIHGS